MASGYFTRVENTVVSGNQLNSYLTGDNVRLLQYDATAVCPPPIVITGAVVAPTPQQWIQAATSSLQVYTGATTGAVDLGTDSASNAAAYCELFNLKSTSDTRVLRFINESAVTSGQIGSLGSQSTHVSIQVWLNSASAAGTQSLFAGVNGVGTALSGVAGAERIVTVSASNLTSGSQVVNFNVLGSSQ